MTCIKMGSDESHFNVSLIVRDKVTRPCPQTTTFEKKGQPKRYRTEVLPLTSLPPYRWAKPALATESSTSSAKETRPPQARKVLHTRSTTTSLERYQILPPTPHVWPCTTYHNGRREGPPPPPLLPPSTPTPHPPGQSSSVRQ